MPGVRNEFDHGVATSLEDQGVMLWHVYVVGSVDDQHRGIAILIEERTQGEPGKAARQLGLRGFGVKTQSVPDDAGHPEVGWPVTGDRCFDRSTEHDGGIDLAGQAGTSRVVPAHRDSEVRHDAMVDCAGICNQPADDLRAAFGRHRYRGFTGARDVEGQYPDAELGCDAGAHAVDIHFPAVHPAAEDDYRCFACQIVRREKVNGDRCGAASVRQIQDFAPEIQTKIGCRESILLELVG